jgi:hypothetical protein
MSVTGFHLGADLRSDVANMRLGADLRSQSVQIVFLLNENTYNLHFYQNLLFPQKCHFFPLFPIFEAV